MFAALFLGVMLAWILAFNLQYGGFAQIRSGLTVNLAESKNSRPSRIDTDRHYVLISVTSRGNDSRYWLYKGETTLERLATQLPARLRRTHGIVYIKCDHRAQYGSVLGLLSVCRQAGAGRVRLLVDERP